MELIEIFRQWLKEKQDCTLDEVHDAWILVYQSKCGKPMPAATSPKIKTMVESLKELTNGIDGTKFREAYSQFLVALLEQFPECKK